MSKEIRSQNPKIAKMQRFEANVVTFSVALYYYGAMQKLNAIKYQF